MHAYTDYIINMHAYIYIYIYIYIYETFLICTVSYTVHTCLLNSVRIYLSYYANNFALKWKLCAAFSYSVSQMQLINQLSCKFFRICSLLFSLFIFLFSFFHFFSSFFFISFLFRSVLFLVLIMHVIPHP